MGEDTEAVMGGVRMGVNVDIKRTDGKKHYTSLGLPPPCHAIAISHHIYSLASYQDPQFNTINGSAGYNQSYVNC